MLADDLSLELTAILDSTPAKVFTAAFVTRTGALYCAFFVWVVGLIPIPEEVRKGDKKLQKISKRLQKVNGNDKRLLQKLDERVGSFYDLSDSELSAMRDFLDFFTS